MAAYVKGVTHPRETATQLLPLSYNSSSYNSLSYNRLVKVTTRAGVGYFIASLCVAVITLVGYRWLHLNPTSIALAYLLGVLGISAYWGLRQALFMSVVA